jgi:putative peptidoglycan binding protein
MYGEPNYGTGEDYGDGWGDYPDAQMSGQTIGMGALWTPPLDYAPSTSSVGSGAAYWPGDVTADAQALNVLQYLSDTSAYWQPGTNSPAHPSTGSQSGDMAASAGAWDPLFQAAVRQAQASFGDTQDGWIGPQTRASLAQAVAAWNQANSPIAPPQPVSPTPPAPDVPPPAVIPGGGDGPGPAPSDGGLTSYLTPKNIAIGLGALVVVGGGLWYFLSE